MVFSVIFSVVKSFIGGSFVLEGSMLKLGKVSGLKFYEKNRVE